MRMKNPKIIHYLNLHFIHLRPIRNLLQCFIFMKRVFYLLCLLFIHTVSWGQVNLNAGLVAYYPFNGNFNDVSGNGNNGTGQNGVGFGMDQWGNPNAAAFFDGIDDWVSITPSASITSSKRLTVAFRFKTNSTSDQIPISKSDVLQGSNGNLNNFQYQLGFNCSPPLPSSNFYFATNHHNSCNSLSLASDYSYAGAIVPNVWYCIAAVFDSGIKSLYVNGLLVNQQPVASGINPTYVDSCVNGNLRFGYWWANDPKWFSGFMDEVRLYNRALSAIEIDSLCNYMPTSETIINKYAAVLSFDPCANELTVDTATDFNVGDTILMIQMKGATIDSSNTAAFGDVLNYNGAGNYEYNVISSKNGNALGLLYDIVRSYDIPQGKVQVVKVPNYQNYTVGQTITSSPWNGMKGGVIAMNVTNTLTLNNNIDATGKGFRGGQFTNATTFLCNQTNYYYPLIGNNGGMKGEGIYEILPNKQYGRGKLSNGGGGGNNTNAGGGGGGNGASGGIGGKQWMACDTINHYGGVGGAALNYSAATDKIFLGGGGGAGHENNFDTDNGGNGGGLVLIKAGSIVGNGSAKIIANGDSCSNVNSMNVLSGDGQSGGGGGGCILLNVTGTMSNFQVEAKGGKGGDLFGPITVDIHGPGGGGGGGSVLFCNTTLPASSVHTDGAINGVNFPYGGHPNGALPGTNGITLSNYPSTFPTDTFKTINLNINFTDSFITCKTRKFINLTSNSSSLTWQWYFGDGATSGQTSPTHTYVQNGIYNVWLIATDSAGCTDSVQKTVVIGGGDTVNINITSCDTTFVFAGQTISTSGTYSLTLQNVQGCDSLILLNLTILPKHQMTISAAICSDSVYDFGGVQLHTSGIYTHLFQNSLGCDSLVTLNLTVVEPQTDTVRADICEDSTFYFAGQTFDSAGTYVFYFENSTGCDSTVYLLLSLAGTPAVNFQFAPIIPETNIPTTFKNTSSNCIGYWWDFGDGTSSSEADPIHQYSETGQYTVCLTGWNAEGCSSTVCKRVDASVFYVIDVPTAFSPNDDGYNDVLYVKGIGVKEFTFRIYNRWGNLVFETNDLTKGWDGTYHGIKQDIEAFAYTLKATFGNNKQFEKQGNITILK